MSDVERGSEKTINYVLEEAKPLADSMLWTLQHTIYEQADVSIWGSGELPQYITNNNYIAKSYAELILAYLRDNYDTLNYDAPIHIIEMGTGTGRLGFFILKTLTRFQPTINGKPVQFRYIMTDIAEKNVNYWQEHRALKPFIDNGSVDFAYYNVLTDNTFTLIKSGETLSADTMQNPVIFIANYFFDSIPQDLFFIEKGELSEGFVSMGLEAEPEDKNNISLNDIILSYEREPITMPHFNDEEYDQMLAGYQERLGETSLLFPRLALNAIRNFEQLSNGRMLLIVGDKGHYQEELLLERGFPHVQHHGGTISMIVNFHAIGQYFDLRGGTTLHTQHLYSHIHASAFILGDSSNHDYVDLRRAYHEHFEMRGPDDFFILREILEKKTQEITVEQSLVYMRFSDWDYSVFYACYPIFFGNMEYIQNSNLLMREVRWSLKHTWDNYYDIQEPRSLAYYIAMLLTGIGYYPDALEFFHLALEEREKNTGVFHNMAICHFKLRNLDEALKYANEALEMNPELSDTRQLRIQIEAEIRRR